MSTESYVHTILLRPLPRFKMGWPDAYSPAAHQFAISPDGQRLGASTAPHDLPVRLLGIGSLLLFVAWLNTQLQPQLVIDVQELVHTQ